DHQMIMIAHQTIGMNLPAGLITGLSERLQKQTPVLIVDEYWLPTVPTIHHMVNRLFILDSQLAWQGAHRLKTPKHVNSHLRPLSSVSRNKRRSSLSMNIGSRRSPRFIT